MFVRWSARVAALVVNRGLKAKRARRFIMSRLVIVSNRVAVPGVVSAGGLAVALQAALEETGGLWFGWSGRIDRRPPAGCTRHASGKHPLHDGRPLQARPRRLLQRLRQSHVVAFAALPRRPGRLQPRHLRRLSPRQRAVCREARASAARRRHRLGTRLPPDPDGQGAARIRACAAGFGFFLHVPMPSSDLLAALPQHERLFEGLSSYDLIGFQTERDLERFQDYVRLFGRGRVIEHGVLETPRAGGCAPARSRSASTPRTSCKQAAAVGQQARRQAIGLQPVRARTGDRRGSPGLFERVCRNAFAPSNASSSATPAHRGKLTFLQIAPVSRGEVAEYQHLRHRTGAARRPHQRRARRAGLDAGSLRQSQLPASAADRLSTGWPASAW